MEPPREYFSMQGIFAFAELQSRPLLEPLARMHQCFPHFFVTMVPRMTRNAADEETLGGASTRQATAQQSSGEDARVVEDQQVARREQRRQGRKPAVAQRAG